MQLEILHSPAPEQKSRAQCKVLQYRCFLHQHSPTSAINSTANEKNDSMMTTGMAGSPWKLTERGKVSCPTNMESNRDCTVAQTTLGSRSRTATPTTHQEAEFMGKPGQDFQKEPRGQRLSLSLSQQMTSSSGLRRGLTPITMQSPKGVWTPMEPECPSTTEITPYPIPPTALHISIMVSKPSFPCGYANFFNL